MKNRFLMTLAALCLCISHTTNASDKYPTRPVTIIAPSGPGGGFDYVGRMMGVALADQTKGNFIVENRTGSGTVIGTKAAAVAQPDGYTLLVGGLSNIVFNAALYKTLSYDAQADFTPISLVARYPYMLVARAGLKQETLAEVLAEARSKPDTLTIATAGNGTGQHVLAAALAKATNAKLLFIPYKSAQAVYIDLLAGRIDLFIDTLPSVKPHLDSRRAKAFFITSSTRNAAVPSVPTAKEAGVPTLEMGSWFGLFAPARTPPAIVVELRAGLNAAMADPALRSRLESAGIEVMSMSPAQTDAFVKSEFSKWTDVIRQANITLD